jgi:uncharacterized protein (DUF427 family)
MANHGPGYARHPEHTVTVQPFHGRVVVEAGGQVIADTKRALELREGTYPPTYYVPREDVRMERLVASEHHTYCPFKGEASYYSLTDGKENAVWSYESPYDEVTAIRDHLAFYPDRVDALRVEPSSQPTE